MISPLENLGCPPYFNLTDCTKNLASYLSENGALNLNIVKSECGHVPNLNKLLNIFLNSHSLVVLINFRGVAFPEPSYPIVLRNVRLAWLWAKRKIKVRKKTMKKWIPDGLIYISGTVVSPKIHQARPFPNFQISTYWNKMVAWNSLVWISLFPHIQMDHMEDEVSLDYICNDEACLENVYNIFPSAVAPIRIFILHKSDIHEASRLGRLISNLNAETRAYTRYYFVSTKIVESTRAEVDHELLITSLSIIQVCRREFRIHINFVVISDQWTLTSDSTDITKSPLLDLCQGSAAMNNLLVSYPYRMASIHSDIKVPANYVIYYELANTRIPTR